MIKLTDENFNKFITENDTVIVDFYSDRCSPCKQLKPVLEGLSKYKIGVLDVDSTTIHNNFRGVTSIPTLLFFKKGKPTKILSGFTNEKDMINKIKKILSEI